MKEEAPDELLGFDRHGLLCVAISIVPLSKGDLAVLELEDAVVADGDPVGVSTEVLKHPLGPVKRRLAVNDPFLVVEPSSEDLKGAGVLEMSDAAGEDKVFILKTPLEMVKEFAPE